MRASPPACAGVALALALGASAPVAQVSFRQAALTTGTPPASIDHALLRGSGPPGSLILWLNLGASGETWQYLSGAWTKLSPLATEPTPRTGFAVANGAGLFGGVSLTNAYLNDTWMAFGAGPTWQQIVAANNTYPPPRTDAAFDVNYGSNLMLGGRDQNGARADCWELREITTPPFGWNWLPAATGPSARYDHRMVHSDLDYGVVLFGGRDANGQALGDTWIFQSGAWTLATPATRPPARSRHVLVSDFLRRRVVMFGGLDQASQPLNDVWEWTGSDWLQRSVAAAPSARGGAAMTWDQATQRCALYGGGGNTDLWGYGTDFPPTSTKLGTTCVFNQFLQTTLDTWGPKPPWIGETFSLAVATVRPNAPSWFLLGLSTTSWNGVPLPLDLGPWIPTPSCKLYQSIDVAIPIVPTTGQARLDVPIPNDGLLAGLTIHAQVYGELSTSSPSAGYRWGTTNGVRVALGMK